MSIQLPEELKRDVPQSTWGRVLTATPVAMTVVATLLAGLASSEMTRAQYDRSLAAQLQSKAGDQWGYFQAKRLRASMQHGMLDLLRSVTTAQPLELTGLPGFAQLDIPSQAALQTGKLPELPAATPMDPKLVAVLEAVDNLRPEAEIASRLAQVSDRDLDDALRAARARSVVLDSALRPIDQAIDRCEKMIAGSPSSNILSRDLAAARFRYLAGRYDVESRLNQVIASLYELQVRKSNVSAEHHHRRSGHFFFGMLGAQAAVIVSTFSLAAQKRSMLWFLAAIAGFAAVVFATYVYFFV